jgi:pimeloyl-ACP methyl ester carboxylesterase
MACERAALNGGLSCWSTSIRIAAADFEHWRGPVLTAACPWLPYPWKWEEARMPADRFATINGHRLRYRIEGEGPLVVFAHGLLGSIEQIAGYTDALNGVRERVRLMLYDARGHGQSEGGEDPDDYSWESLGRDMVGLIERAGEQRAILAGASMGAASSLWVALEDPARVQALVLVMPPPLGPDELYGDDERQAIGTLSLLAGTIQQFGLEQTAELARQYLAASGRPGEVEEQIGLLLGQNPRTIGHVISGLTRSRRHNLDDYRRISAPTLIVAHERDGLHPMRSARLLADAIPGSRMVVGPEPGYWQSHPDEFVAVVDGFLAGVPGLEPG